MQPVQGDAFDDLFRTFERTACHLELKDSYHTPHETGPFDRFMKGQPDDFAWHQPWLRLVGEATQAGKSISRVRVVTVPHSDYVHWGLTVAPLNIRAGEDVRWLPRHLTGGINFPSDDYWLFDDNRVVFTVFEDDGSFAGGMETFDSGVIEQCHKVYEQVWALAVPHSEYASI